VQRVWREALLDTLVDRMVRLEDCAISGATGLVVAAIDRQRYSTVSVRFALPNIFVV